MTDLGAEPASSSQLETLQRALRTPETPVYRGIRVVVCPSCGLPLDVRRVEAGVMLVTGVFLPRHGWYKATCCDLALEAPDAPKLREMIETAIKTMVGRPVWR